jgi:hypothetical protein
MRSAAHGNADVIYTRMDIHPLPFVLQQLPEQTLWAIDESPQGDHALERMVRAWVHSGICYDGCCQKEHVQKRDQSHRELRP